MPATNDIAAVAAAVGSVLVGIGGLIKGWLESRARRAAEARSTTLEMERQRRSDAIQEWRQFAIEMRDEVARLRKRLEEAEAETIRLRDRLDDAEAECDRLRREIAELRQHAAGGTT